MRWRDYAKDRGLEMADVTAAAATLGFDSAHQAATITDDEAAALDRHFAERAVDAPRDLKPTESPTESPADDEPVEEESPAAEAPPAPPPPDVPIADPQDATAEPVNEPVDLLDQAAAILESSGQIPFTRLAGLLRTAGWQPPPGVDASRHLRARLLRDIVHNPQSRFRHAAKRLVRLK